MTRARGGETLELTAGVDAEQGPHQPGSSSRSRRSARPAFIGHSPCGKGGDLPHRVHRLMLRRSWRQAADVGCCDHISAASETRIWHLVGEAADIYRCPSQIVAPESCKPGRTSGMAPVR